MPNVTWLRVVGVAASVKLKGLAEEGENARVGAYYLPFDQAPSRNIGIAVRGSGDPAAIRVSLQRALMLLSLTFGVIALLLASAGLYSVLAYQVSQRTREFGIRLALGSQATGVQRLVLGEGICLAGVGLAGGLSGAWALRGVISSQLYGVGPLDPAVMAVAAAMLALTSLAASLGPARRAARVNPQVALTKQ